MFKLLANNNVVEENNSLETMKEELEEYKKIEEAMFGKNELKFEIVEVV